MLLVFQLLFGHETEIARGLPRLRDRLVGIAGGGRDGPECELLREAELEACLVRIDPALGQVDDPLNLRLRDLPEKIDEKVRHLEPLRCGSNSFVDIHEPREIHNG